VKRIAASIVLLIVGAGLLYYGAARHGVSVYVEQEREVSILVPSPMGGGFDGPASPGSAGGIPAADGSVAGSGEQNPFESPAAGGEKNPFQPAPSASVQDPGGMLGAMQVKTLREKILVAQQEPEASVVREITVGGLALLADGMLKRTYSGRPPSLCPT
jgi:hypothetical protein